MQQTDRRKDEGKLEAMSTFIGFREPRGRTTSIIIVFEQEMSVPENGNILPLVVSVEMIPNVWPRNDFKRNILVIGLFQS